MNAIAFDTHAHVKRLLGAGMTEDQAEAVIEAVRQMADLPDLGHLATKADLREIRSELRLVKTEPQAGLTALRSETRGEFAACRGEINGVHGEINGVRDEIRGVRGELIWWIIGACLLSSLSHLFIK